MKGGTKALTLPQLEGENIQQIGLGEGRSSRESQGKEHVQRENRKNHRGTGNGKRCGEKEK